MDQATRMNSMPPAPIFGVAGGSDGSAGGSMGGSKFINIDEIFADCFVEGDGSDLLGLERPGGAGVETSAGGHVAGEGAGVGGDAGAIASEGGVDASGASGLRPGSYAGAGTTPVMMQPPAHQQQQQQQTLSPTPIGGLSMFLGGGGADMGGVTGEGGQGIGGVAAVGGAGVGAASSTARVPSTVSSKAKASLAGAAASPAPSRSMGGARGGSQSGRGYSGRGDRGRGTGGSSGGYGARTATMAGLDEDDEDERGGKRGSGTAGGKRPRQGGRNMTEQQRLDRRERNREHAKRSRVRKKFLLESLQKSVTALQEENEKLRDAIRANLGADEAKELLSQTETTSVVSSNPGEATKVLDDPDYSLVKALQTAQQNFVITDPTLPDNPIVFASQGFLELTGYTLDQVLGRNCRFLQGPDTDPKAVEKIRKAIEKGMDTSVCLRNYRVDGAMFWNQFFIAALRDSDGDVINYVGVQCRVDEDFVRAVQRREGEEGEGDGEEDEDDDDDRSDAEEKDAAG